MAKNQVVVSILGDNKSLNSALGNSESALSKFGKVAGAVAIAAGVAVAAIGVKAVKSASELEQAMGGLESVFKGATPQMENFANKAAQSVGLAKSEYAGLATVLGSQLKNMGVATDQLAGQTDGLITMGADLAAQFGGSTSDAVSALSSLLRGERDPIERYGVSINDAAIKAKLAEMGLSGLTGEAEKNAKLQATLALLNQQTADSMGAFSREANTLAGSQQRLAAGTENLYATLGTALLPAVTAVVGALGSLIAKVQESAVFQAFTGWLTDASNAFADFIYNILNGQANLDFSGMFSGLLDAAVSGITSAANWLASGGAAVLVNGIVSSRAALFDAAFSVFPAILEALVAAIPAIITGVVSLVTQLAAMLVTQAPIILAGALQLFTALVQAVVTILPTVIQAIVTLLPLLITTLLGMVPTLLDSALLLFTAIVEAIPLIIPPLISGVLELLPQIINTVISMIPKLIDGALKLFLGIVEAIPKIVPQLISGIISLLPTLLSSLIKMIPALINGAVQLFVGIVTAIPKIIPELIGALIGLLPVIIGAVIGMVPQLIRAGVDLIGGLIKGIGQMAGAVGNALINIAKNAIGGFLSFLGIKSPSRLFMSYGKYIDQGLAKGITGNLAVVDKAMGKLNTAVTDGWAAPALNSSEMSLAMNQGHLASRTAGGTPVTKTYNITVQAIAPSAEVGRVVVEAINDYESAGGRL